MEPLIRGLIKGLNHSGLRDVQVRGTLPAGGCVWAANHHSWWDGFAAAAALWSGGRRGALVMDSANLGRFGYLRRIGVVGTDELPAAIAALRAGEPLVIFPEGQLRAPGQVRDLKAGAAVLAARSGTPLLPVATRAAMRARAAPEYLIDIGPPVEGGDIGEATQMLTEALNSRLRDLDELIAGADPEAPLAGFRVVQRGRRDWDERFGGGGAL